MKIKILQTAKRVILKQRKLNSGDAVKREQNEEQKRRKEIVNGYKEIKQKKERKFSNSWSALIGYYQHDQ